MVRVVAMSAEDVDIVIAPVVITSPTGHSPLPPRRACCRNRRCRASSAVLSIRGRWPDLISESSQVLVQQAWGRAPARVKSRLESKYEPKYESKYDSEQVQVSVVQPQGHYSPRPPPDMSCCGRLEPKHTHQQTPLHRRRHSVRQPARPIDPFPPSQREDKHHRTGTLDPHRAETERADEFGAVRLVDLRRVLGYCE
jgi:hypothetical protein